MIKVQDYISSLISEKQYYLRFFFLDIGSIAWPTLFPAGIHPQRVSLSAFGCVLVDCALSVSAPMLA